MQTTDNHNKREHIKQRTYAAINFYDLRMFLDKHTFLCAAKSLRSTHYPVTRQFSAIHQVIYSKIL